MRQKKSLNGLFDSKEDKVRREYFARYYLEENINELESIINREFGGGTYDDWADKYGYDSSDVPDPDTIYSILAKNNTRTLQKIADRGEKAYKERWGADGWSEQLKKLRTKGLGSLTRKNNKKMATKRRTTTKKATTKKATSRKKTSAKRKSRTLNGGVALSAGNKLTNYGEAEIRKKVHKLEHSADGTGLTHEQIKSCINSYWQAVGDAVKAGKNVQIYAVGSIRKTAVNGGKGRKYRIKNTKTGKVSTGVTKEQVKFVVSDLFKKEVGAK